MMNYPTYNHTRGDSAATPCPECEAVCAAAAVGRKDDQKKARWDLIPFRALTEIVDVLTYGAEKKYGADNWRSVPDSRRRYFAAAQRHLVDWWQGERNDPESGLHHLGHACCCVLFLLALELESAPRS